MAARPDGDLEIMGGRAAASEQQCAACNREWCGVGEGSHRAKPTGAILNYLYGGCPYDDQRLVVSWTCPKCSTNSSCNVFDRPVTQSSVLFACLAYSS